MMKLITNLLGKPEEAKSNMNEEQAISDLREQEATIRRQIRDIEYQRWDRELVGRFFREGYDPQSNLWIAQRKSIGVDESPIARQHVYMKEKYFHVRERRGTAMLISGFTLSAGEHADWGGEMIKISTADYSLEDFIMRQHYDGVIHQEISKEEYYAALQRALTKFAEIMGASENLRTNVA